MSPWGLLGFGRPWSWTQDGWIAFSIVATVVIAVGIYDYFRGRK